HGGTVQAESPGEGQGATFTVRLPFATLPADAGGTMSEPDALMSSPRPTSLNGMAVLVVDDDSDSLEVAAVTLENHGATAITASSASEALGVLARHHVHVLISDIAMPGEDGSSLIRKIRQREAGTAQHLAAIALSAFARTQDRDEAVR